MSTNPAPRLNIPSSDSTCNVSIIDTTCRIKVTAGLMMMPHILGHDFLECPAYSFLVENVSQNRRVLFDLGVRKDWENLAPSIMGGLKSNNFEISFQEVKDVADVLIENGVDLASIEAIIWSHSHFDHIGDPATFPSSTALIVGPGTQEALFPGYPANQEATTLESDYKDREIQEINFAKTAHGLTLGRYQAVDYFNDGSLYILDAPGHAVGHICALVRTTPSTFMFLGGDTCHHAGEFRPTEYLPLPSHVPHQSHPSPTSMPCPCSIFENIHPNKSRVEPYYTIAVTADGKTVANDIGEALESIVKMEEFDANEDVFTVIAHDPSLVGVADFFPKRANAWKEKEWADRTRWEFLKDFDSKV